MWRPMDDCYTFNISTNIFVPKQNMNYGRTTHGLQKISQKIFAFGGEGHFWKPMKSAEVYDYLKNTWKNLPDMPEEGCQITCVRVQNQILISSYQFRLMSYDIDNKAYSYVGQQNSDEASRCVVSS